MAQIVKNFTDVISRLGDLHDSRITAIIYDREANKLSIEIDDFFAHLEGLATYPGPNGGEIVFEETVTLQISISDDTVAIYETSTEEHDEIQSTTFSLWSSGSIVIKSRSVCLPEPIVEYLMLQQPSFDRNI